MKLSVATLQVGSDLSTIHFINLRFSLQCVHALIILQKICKRISDRKREWISRSDRHRIPLTLSLYFPCKPAPCPSAQSIHSNAPAAEVLREYSNRSPPGVRRITPNEAWRFRGRGWKILTWLLWDSSTWEEKEKKNAFTAKSVEMLLRASLSWARPPEY